MSCSSSRVLQVGQGLTYTQVYRWGAEPFVYKAVSAIVSQAPFTLTAIGHGVPDGWPVAFTDFSGFKNLNAADWPPSGSDFYSATVGGVDTLSFNAIDATRLLNNQTIGFGSIAYLTPVDLTSTIAVFNVYAYPSPGQGIATDPSTLPVPPVPIISATATVDNTGKTISITLTATQTAMLNAAQYTYALLATKAGVVTMVDSGQIQIFVPGAQGSPNV